MPHEMEKERQRLAALYALELLDTASSKNFDRICHMAAQIFGTPTALISLVDRDRQWFKARVGFAEPETPISQSFCTYTIKQDRVFQIENALSDHRFAQNPLVLSEGGIRFYAGAPLRTSDGHAIGSLCIIDSTSRTLSESDQRLLQDLAALVMDQIEQEQRSRRLDPISLLPNRLQFQADFHDLAQTHSGESRTLVIIDALDIMWAYSLTLAFGMPPFEKAIQTIAQRLQDYLGSEVRIYHISVKRFGFLVADNPVPLETMLDELIGILREPFVCIQTPVVPKVCAGILDFIVDQDSVLDAMRKAMFAVESAALSHTPWAYYDSIKDQINRRSFSLSSDIEDALVNGEIYIVFQPRFDLHSGLQTSAEALMRWSHARLGEISPAEFIPVAEKSLLIQRLTGWLIDSALKKMASWPLSVSAKISINLSPKDFENQSIFETLRAACATYGVSPERLEVEITEGEWLRSNPGVIAQLHSIRQLGIDIAIDDFGTGYSNFSYLSEIPANIVKLDRSLITDLPNNTQSQIIARSVFALAKELGYKTVAEGIESFECMKLVKAYGCDEAQGYYLAKPMSEHDLLERAANNGFPLRTPPAACVPAQEQRSGEAGAVNSGS